MARGIGGGGSQTSELGLSGTGLDVGHFHAASIVFPLLFSFLHHQLDPRAAWSYSEHTNRNVSDECVGIAKNVGRQGTRLPLLQQLLALRVWGRLGAETRTPCARGLQSSTVPGYDGGAMAGFFTAVPDSLSPGQWKLEAGVALL